jgi:hypothetical protein
MAQIRYSQELWDEWYGNEIPSELVDPVLYFAYEWLDLEDERIRASLCYLLKRHGIVETIGEALLALEHSVVNHGFIYYNVGEPSPSFTLPDKLNWAGPTEAEGERPATLVEFEVGN